MLVPGLNVDLDSWRCHFLKLTKMYEDASTT
jgi:hypothetical protein